MEENNWDEFWGVRKIPLKTGQLAKFHNNYRIMEDMVKEHYDIECVMKYIAPKSISSLEVGCGRGTLSNYFEMLGWDTHLCDIGDHQLKPHNNFSIVNVFELKEFYGKQKFDVVFSYGLLEHFKLKGQMEMLDQIGQVMNPDGISIHYVVPSKLTNINEDRSVYRDNCNLLLKILGEERVQWVFPMCDWGKWKTNKYLGKGFLFGMGNK